MTKKKAAAAASHKNNNRVATAVSQLEHNDVVFSRAASRYRYHPGNMAYLDLVDECCFQMGKLQHRTSQQYADMMLRIWNFVVQEQQGRFLNQQQHDKTEYVVLNRKEAYAKIKGSLGRYRKYYFMGSPAPVSNRRRGGAAAVDEDDDEDESSNGAPKPRHVRRRSKDPHTSMDEVIPFAPQKHDVIFGVNDTSAMNHPGNIFYRSLLQQYFPRLEKANDPTTEQYRAMVQDILHVVVTQRKGRFLRPTDSKGRFQRKSGDNNNNINIKRYCVVLTPTLREYKVRCALYKHRSVFRDNHHHKVQRRGAKTSTTRRRNNNKTIVSDSEDDDDESLHPPPPKTTRMTRRAHSLPTSIGRKDDDSKDSSGDNDDDDDDDDDVSMRPRPKTTRMTRRAHSLTTPVGRKEYDSDDDDDDDDSLPPRPKTTRMTRRAHSLTSRVVGRRKDSVSEDSDDEDEDDDQHDDKDDDDNVRDDNEDDDNVDSPPNTNENNHQLEYGSQHAEMEMRCWLSQHRLPQSLVDIFVLHGVRGVRDIRLSIELQPDFLGELRELDLLKLRRAVESMDGNDT